MNLSEALNKKSVKGDIAVVFIVRDGKLLIGLRNYTAKDWRDISVWTVPGGHCEPGEDFEEAARREAKEEVNLDDLVFTKFLGVVPGAKEGDTVYAFQADTKEEPEIMERDLFSEWKWCPLSEVPSNFINPEALNLLKKKTI